MGAQDPRLLLEKLFGSIGPNCQGLNADPE
jgi:hypothetical protein